MRSVVLASTLASALALAAPAARAQDRDPWFGPDKALHFGISVGLAAGGYGVSSLFLDRRTERAIAGGAFSLALGGGKELWDLAGHGDPSWKDFTWDVAGTAVGLGLALLVDVALAPSDKKSGAPGTARMALVF